jgi:hypothetical protein
VIFGIIAGIVVALVVLAAWRQRKLRRRDGDVQRGDSIDLAELRKRQGIGPHDGGGRCFCGLNTVNSPGDAQQASTRRSAWPDRVAPSRGLRGCHRSCRSRTNCRRVHRTEGLESVFTTIDCTAPDSSSSPGDTVSISSGRP